MFDGCSYDGQKRSECDTVRNVSHMYADGKHGSEWNTYLIWSGMCLICMLMANMAVSGTHIRYGQECVSYVC